MPTRFLNLNHRAWTISQTHRRRSAITLPDIRYSLIGHWLSALERLFPRVERPERPPPPVIILGHWRSGTTLLHELLVSSGAFAFPSTYACMNPHAFLLARGITHTPVHAAERPMDAMVIRTDLPQEDEFALFCLGARSPYTTLLFPNGISQLAADCDSAHWTSEEVSRWSDAFLRFTAACQSQAKNCPLLLKSPPHSFKTDLITQLLPGVRFVQIVRDPSEVYLSTRKLWRSLWALYALEEAPDLSVCDDAILSTMIELDAAIERAPSDRRFLVRFEDLVSAPRQTMEKLLVFLEQPRSRLEGAPISERIRAMAGHPRSQRHLTDEERQLIRSRCAGLCAKYGYLA